MSTQQINALKAIIKLLDGSQPKDVPGALMVAKHALELEMKQGGWRPMKTAPTTGRSLILLASPICEIAHVAYANTWWRGGFSAGEQPTHWMPIPTPPSKL